MTACHSARAEYVPSSSLVPESPLVSKVEVQVLKTLTVFRPRPGGAWDQFGTTRYAPAEQLARQHTRFITLEPLLTSKNA